MTLTKTQLQWKSKRCRAAQNNCKFVLAGVKNAHSQTDRVIMNRNNVLYSLRLAIIVDVVAMLTTKCALGCEIFPPNNILNARVDAAPIHANSDAYIQSIGYGTSLHPDFGSGLWAGGPIGIPYNVVTNKTTTKKVKFLYASESDNVGYPIPSKPKIEYGSDHHMLMVNNDTCVLYELYAAQKTSSGWKAGSGAVFDLKSNALRPATWTSADAAGLPIFPLLVRRDEVVAGAINHAIRFTAGITREDYVWPARHEAGSTTSASVPPMGQRFRLKASFDISSFSPDTKVILTAMKKYGIILADNGSNWFISGEPNSSWNNDKLVNEFRQVHGSDFEAVDVSGLMVNENSGQVV